jgi:TM2 domain-containing membrane protein YozV
LKKDKSEISTQIKSWCKKKIVFANTLLPYGAIEEAYTHCTHLQIAPADSQPPICKRVQFSPPLKDAIKYIFIIILLTLSLNVFATDYYITTSDLNLRNGAGKNYKSLVIISKGDTIKLIDNTDNYWVKIQYHDKIGYSSKQFLQKIQIQENAQKEKKTKESESGSFPMLMAFIILFIIIPIILTKSGKKNRNIFLAQFASFFFGAIGFQKFYLGQTNKGIFSMLFCWTFIPSLIGLIDFIKLASMSEDKFNIKYNGGIIPIKKPIFKTQKIKVKQFSRHTNVSPNSKWEHKSTDQSIIDINAEKLDLTIEQSASSKETASEPPFWGHTYIYSYDEILHATKAQKKYYYQFKYKVLNNEFVDIQGNSNYAFILYFDMLNEYENHLDIKLLENQFKILGQICPKTKSYSLHSLQDELRKRSDSYSVDKLKNLEEPSYQFEHDYSDYDPDAYKLGKQYKDQLELSKQEVVWLNKFWNPSNVFISIEGCCIASMKQYLLIIKSLNKKLKGKNTSVAKEVDFFKEKIVETEEIVDSYWGDYDKSYMKQRVESEIYLTIFKRAENSVREFYGHKRKVGSTPYYDYKGDFENRIGNYVNELVLEHQNKIIHPDIKTQIELNAQNVNRWKSDFNTLKDSFQKDDNINFIQGIINLEETNQKNPNIENVFFEASKFIAKYDNVQSLKYYAKYIYYDLKSKKFDNKELTKTVRKSLFKTDGQINDFKIIIAELIETSDIQKALDRIDEIYILKRKEIKLDKSIIKEIEKKHDGTVELLSGYLDTENEEVIKPNIENEEIEISIIPTNINNTILSPKIIIGKIQEELIKKIVSNSFEIRQDEVDKFATENGLFKNQLIDSINEACANHLEGEALIEEDDENYVIEKSYYKEIAI